MNFARTKRDVFERLREDRALDAWKKSGGLDRLRAMFRAMPVHTYKRPEEWTERTAALARSRPLAVRAYPETGQPGEHFEAVAAPWSSEPDGAQPLHVAPLRPDTSGPLVDLDHEPAALDAFERRRVMLEIMERDTGNTVDPTKAVDALQRREELDRQTREIAERLRDGWRRIAAEALAAAVRCRDLGQRDLMRAAALRWKDFSRRSALRSTPFSLFFYFIHSRTVVRREQFRRIMFLPAVAQQVRAPKLLALEAFIDRNPFARMFTLTSGPRVTVEALRERIERFHRSLSRFAVWLRKKHAVEMVFRSTELGSMERRPDGSPDANAGALLRDAHGRPTYHVHAHTLVRSLTGYRSPERWAAVRRSIWDKWGFHWDDSGQVADARELVKYICKPAEVCKLAQDDLCALYEALKGLRLVAPMGALRAEIRERKEAERTFDREPTADGRVLREVPDWNRWPKARKEPSAIENLRTVLETRPCDDRAQARRVALGRLMPSDVPARVAARLAPSFAPGSLVSEPRVAVLALRWDQAQVDRIPLVVDLRAATAPQWAAGRALALRVHVGTSTATAEFPAAAGWDCRAPPDPVPSAR